jgi:hypothetical protein
MVKVFLKILYDDRTGTDIVLKHDDNVPHLSLHVLDDAGVFPRPVVIRGQLTIPAIQI